MKKNVGGAEQVIRIIAGIAILSLAFVGPQSNWAISGSCRSRQRHWLVPGL